jgi:hypothetical protein
MIIWHDKNGKIISCVEKIKILNQNFHELKNLHLDFIKIKKTLEYDYALEDAILMGIGKEDFDEILRENLKIISSL